ncbi:glutathione S-transferase P 1-like [Lissotriton helveticus]
MRQKQMQASLASSKLRRFSSPSGKQSLEIQNSSRHLFADENSQQENPGELVLFGQLPMFADGDFILFQSKAVFRHLARKYDLYGKNHKEAALIDMANDGMEDLREKLLHLILHEWDTGRPKYVEDLPNQLRPFEHLLSQNASGFIAGSTVSFADYNLLDIIHNQLFLDPDCLSSFPHLKAFKGKMESRPKLKIYLQSDDHKNRPFLVTKKL